MADDRKCLNCGETKASIRRQKITLCGIEGGYEYRELEYEFPNHRWADWTDKELAAQGIRPEAYVKHRRTSALTLGWAGCEDTVRGHTPASTEADLDWVDRLGQCISCGKQVDEEIQTQEGAE